MSVAMILAVLLLVIGWKCLSLRGEAERLKGLLRYRDCGDCASYHERGHAPNGQPEDFVKRVIRDISIESEIGKGEGSGR